MGQRYQDLISDVNAATAAVSADLALVAADQHKLAADQTTLTTATAARDSAIIDAAEAVVVDNGDGTFAIYEDNGAGKVIVKKGIAGSTPLPGTLAPASSTSAPAVGVVANPEPSAASAA